MAAKRRKTRKPAPLTPAKKFQIIKSLHTTHANLKKLTAQVKTLYNNALASNFCPDMIPGGRLR